MGFLAPVVIADRRLLDRGRPIQAGAGIAIGIAVVYSIPARRRRMWLANATAGVLMIVGAGVLHAVG
jgi:hypothetical protein